MADRSVSVHLKANVAGYIAGIEQAKLKTTDFAKSAAKNADEHKASWDKVGKGMMLTGGVIAVGVGLAVKTFADFDKQMSAVEAVTYDASKSLTANAASMDKLRAAALKAGADTKFSAGEAAKAEEELAKVGISTSDILGGALTGSLNLAAAGNLELSDAAAISGKAMKIFNLQGKDVGHIADVLASGANKSAADVTDLGQALAQGGLIAAQTGLTLEDTVGTLSAFADNALMGSDAGTSMKTMLMRLNPQSDEAAGLMDELGLRAYDAGGKFIGMSEYAGKLKTNLAGMSDEQRNAAMTTLFGSDAVRAANILYKIGAEGVDEYTQAVNDQGAAARVAAIQMDNLAGDLDALRGSVETALIQAGSGGNDTLRDMAQFATGAVNAFGELPAPVQGTVVKVAALGAVALLTGGALVTLVPKAQAARKALADMGVTAGRSGTLLKGLGLAAGVALVALPLLEVAADKVSRSLGQLAPDAEAAKGAITALADGGKASGESADLINRHFEDLSNTVNNVFSPELGHKVSAFFSQISPGNLMGFETSETNQSIEFFKTLDAGLTQMVSSGNGDKAAEMFKKITTEAEKQGYALSQVQSAVPGYTAVLDEAIVAADGVASATGGTVAPTKELAQSEKDMAAAADEAKKAHDALTDSITSYGSAMMTARGDARSYEAAIDAATASLKENGKTLDIGTEKGRANEAALDAIATSALKMAESNLAAAEANGALSKASKDVTGDVKDARKAFIDQAVAMGKPRKAAERLATAAGLTTDRVRDITNELIVLGKQAPAPKITLTGEAAAMATADRLQARIDRMHGRNLNVHVSYSGGVAGQGHTNAEANGGHVVAAAANGMDRQSRIAKGGANILWAEPETGWETYISGKPSQRARNIGLLTETASRFGLTVAKPQPRPNYVSAPPRPAAHAGVPSGGDTIFQAYGLDADKAVQRAMRQWEFKQVPR